MGFVSDLRILYHMAFASGGGDSHGERLEAFYRQQPAAEVVVGAGCCTAAKR
jgi:hypothetical protein